MEHHKYWFQLNFRADFKCRARNINCFEPLNQESICSESQIKIIKVAQSQKVFSIWSQSLTLFYFSTFEWFKFATFGTMGTFLYYTFFRSSKKRLENEKMNISPTLKASNIQRLQIWGTLFLFCKSLKLRSNWNYLHRLNYLYRQFDFDYMMSKSCFKNEIWKLLFYTEIPGVSWIQECGEIGAVSLKVTRGTFS